MFDDKGIGCYTYYSPMGASTINYVILKEDYMISKFKVLAKLVESDHCPIQFYILNSKLKELSSADINIHVNDSPPCSNVYGKMKKRTTDNIFIICAIIDKQRCLSKPLYTCFVDFTKAFDYIDRSALYYKLLSRGIHGNLLNVIKSMFSKAECRVKWDSCISEILKSEFGVLQGGMLSPKLFAEFLQDISKSFDQGQGIPVDTLLIVYWLFADDLVLFSDSANGLQKQLTALYKYASLWH